MQNKNGNPPWILKGLLWGGFMFVALGIVIPLTDGVALQIEKVLMKLFFWLVLGVVYGYALYLIEKRKK